MKTLTITPPYGHEIDKDKSTFEQIVFKKIEDKLPLSVKEIPNREHYVNGAGIISKALPCYNDINQLSTESRAKAFLALMQLVELRDAWNGEWEAEWGNTNQVKYGLHYELNNSPTISRVLHFKSMDLRDKFEEQFKDLIEQAKELL